MVTKGSVYPGEAVRFHDSATGVLIRQVTNFPAIHHHPFFMIPAYDDKMRRLYFISHRTGSAQIFAECRSSGELLQLTDRPDIAEWSVHPSHNGKYVYFTTGTGAWRVNVESLEEELLADFGNAAMREKGMVAAGMGTTALSRDDRWWAVRYTLDNMAHLAVIDTSAGTWNSILARDQISHMQFCPDDANLLFYAGPLTDRVWLIQRDGANNRRLYERNAEKKEWITHETWIPGTRELAFVDWPNGLRCIRVDNGKERKLAGFNAWHAAFDRTGTRMVADTNFPDNGLQFLNVKDGTGEPRLLCLSRSSNKGSHWNGPFPYDHGPIEVYAPQYTHPHPSFSADGRFVVFTSDYTGNSQIYEVAVPENL